ncbi:MAG TPA: MEDS domain-containing protein [Actinomycetota bacterium]|nr:MEDS domain-containing protein [Actinomycetota bacterium]
MAADHLDLSILAPARRAPRAGDHFVEFHEDDDSLVELIRTFLSPALLTGESALVVATPARRRAIAQRLTASGIDVEAAVNEGRYLSLDADETLSRFMFDGELDEAVCVETLEALLVQAAQRGNNVRVFGEMVAVLWAQGNVTGAIALERVWNRLAETLPFRLFCSYPVHAFATEDAASLREICRHHSHVIPPA